MFSIYIIVGQSTTSSQGSAKLGIKFDNDQPFANLYGHGEKFDIDVIDKVVILGFEELGNDDFLDSTTLGLGAKSARNNAQGNESKDKSGENQKNTEKTHELDRADEDESWHKAPGGVVKQLSRVLAAFSGNN